MELRSGDFFLFPPTRSTVLFTAGSPRRALLTFVTPSGTFECTSIGRTGLAVSKGNGKRRLHGSSGPDSAIGCQWKQGGQDSSQGQ